VSKPAVAAALTRESSTTKLAKFFPNATPVRIPVRLTRLGDATSTTSESTVIEFGTPQEVLFASSLPLEFADKLRLSQLATSLGGTHTVVSHVASTTHRQLDGRALAAGGIDPGAVRFSIGLEDAEDLISDAYVALESLSRP